jgi:hypothetical protein
MEAAASEAKRILECVEEAKSPRRILVRSLLKSRNALRAKYRELRAECKRWRNQAAAVAKSRDAWRRRALAGEAALRDERAGRPAPEARAPGPPEPSADPAAEPADPRARSADPEGVEKRGR